MASVSVLQEGESLWIMELLLLRMDDGAKGLGMSYLFVHSPYFMSSSVCGPTMGTSNSQTFIAVGSNRELSR